jgi:hypothetical protein
VNIPRTAGRARRLLQRQCHLDQLLLQASRRVMTRWSITFDICQIYSDMAHQLMAGTASLQPGYGALLHDHVLTPHLVDLRDHVAVVIDDSHGDLARGRDGEGAAKPWRRATTMPPRRCRPELPCGQRDPHATWSTTRPRLYHFGSHAGAEVDLVLERPAHPGEGSSGSR